MDSATSIIFNLQMRISIFKILINIKLPDDEIQIDKQPSNDLSAFGYNG